MDGDEPTQATQNILDPRRVGKQNSGFSDDDVSDIICVLYPQTEPTRQEVLRLAREDSPYIIGKEEADGVEPDYDHEDHASRFESNPTDHGNYAIILRLSARVKNPSAGYTFGRNATRCDIVFTNDPMRRLSNIHFCIYANEFGNVMIEDKSTNGTFVDNKLLCSRSKNGEKPITKWVLTSGALVRIYLHVENRDLSFLVRIPRRDDDYERAYLSKVDEYFVRHGLKAPIAPPPQVPAARPAGPVDVFKTPGDPIVRRALPDATNAGSAHPSPSKRKNKETALPREWNGSGIYNRIKKVGKGAFAVVYKVTAKFDGQPYAAKEIEKRRFIKNGVLDQKVENEMKIMRRVQHPHIVRYMEHIDWESLLIIIMEYVPGGDLGRLIAEDGAFPEHMAQTMARQLLSALGYLHANNITHRDVKPDNILIKTIEPLDVKLTDFGLSKIVDTDHTFLTTFCGTLLYCAPEVYTEYAEYDDNGVRSRGKKMRRLPGQRYSHAVDIWSLGGVLFYTLTRSPPYPVESGITHSALLQKIMTTTLNVSPLERYGVTEQAVDFLHRMLQRRPENRATIPELENHAWFGGQDSVIRASQSYDEITDDEDVIIEPSQVPPTMYEEDRVSDSAEESEKENEPSAQPRPPRLFGEIGVSAVGSSGALPSDLMPPPVNETTSQGETEILDLSRGDGYDSADSDTVGARTRRAHAHNQTSVYPVQSADELLSLVDDVASQSLGGQQDEGQSQDPGLSRYLSLSVDANSSKRKPPSLEVSDESNENVAPGKLTFKRLKPDGDDEITEDMMSELQLLASVPQIRRLHSGRQADSPVNKATYWEQDYQTWHLQYPEMTQLQYDAFVQAARDRREEFSPGKSPLWDLAMKYFPPSSGVPAQNGVGGTGAMPSLKRDDRKFVDTISPDIPSTAPIPMMQPSRPAPDPNVKIVVPVLDKPLSTGAMAMIETAPISCVRGITVAITDTFVSFGRATENTEVYGDRLQSRVPKYAFKIMLWKEGFDPSRDPSKTVAPWQGASSADTGSYHYWISTKATLGIRINGYSLASSDIKNPGGPARFWAKIHDGDALTIWGPSDPDGETQLIFRCFWGGSAKRRSQDRPQLELAIPAVAQKLDAACAKTERRIRESSEKRSRREQVNTDYSDRLRRAPQERERSHAFERKRAEAVEFLAASQSPGYVPTGGQRSRLHPAMTASRFAR
ncbi:hypothetical protein HIM_07950 [Hirsutella minnesotensis 3608]|uniref:Autophagy-related protein 1 n=1 Tax=Hirsutella minnesotensis 3608 TaxID=1043627 RepID=A0A0F7ZHG3_9HYPO|nr:hypothetical protein HIM_07950 [Hirsutella minnesotensis 3608]